MFTWELCTSATRSAPMNWGRTIYNLLLFGCGTVSLYFPVRAGPPSSHRICKEIFVFTASPQCSGSWAWWNWALAGVLSLLWIEIPIHQVGEPKMVLLWLLVHDFLVVWVNSPYCLTGSNWFNLFYSRFFLQSSTWSNIGATGARLTTKGLWYRHRFLDKKMSKHSLKRIDTKEHHVRHKCFMFRL